VTTASEPSTKRSLVSDIQIWFEELLPNICSFNQLSLDFKQNGYIITSLPTLINQIDMR
jgi:hypothetical protein